MLGKGGLGEVMACDDTVLQRTVALKAGHIKGDVDSYSTKVILAREARIISGLEHPNIIPIYDAGVDPMRGPFYVMRQVTDTSLEMILHQRKTRRGQPARLHAQSPAALLPPGLQRGRLRAPPRRDPLRHQAGEHPPR